MVSLFQQCIAEAIGTFLLVLFGTGSVASAVTTGSLTGLWQVAVVWGFGVALSIFATAGVSGAHLNPAVSLALCIRRNDEMPVRKLVPYVFAQLCGSTLAGLAVLGLYGTAIKRYSTEHDTRTAMVFGEYFPNPGTSLLEEDITVAQALFIEGFGTMILMFLILALTDPRNPSRPPPGMAPFFIGFTVAVLISVLAPLTQAGFNPARDFGPRIIAALSGWGLVAIPGPRDGFLVYIFGPIIGAPIGACLYDFLIAPALPDAKVEPAADNSLCKSGCWDPSQAELQLLIFQACSSACGPNKLGGCTPLPFEQLQNEMVAAKEDVAASQV